MFSFSNLKGFVDKIIQENDKWVHVRVVDEWYGYLENMGE
jgi:hypothetical protein